MSYACKLVKILMLFKVRHHWFPAKESIDWRIGRTFTLWAHDLNWTHVCRSYGVPEVIWVSYVYPVFALCSLVRSGSISENRIDLSKNIDHYLFRIWAFFEISVNEQITPERGIPSPSCFLPFRNWNSLQVELLQQSIEIFFTLALFSLANYSSERWIQIDAINTLLIKCRYRNTKTCWLHRSLNFFIKPFFKIRRFRQIKKNKMLEQNIYSQMKK